MKNIKSQAPKIFFSILFCLFCAVSSFSADSATPTEETEATKRQTLKIGVFDIPPFAIYDKKTDTWSGLSIAVLKYAMDKMGYDYKITLLPLHEESPEIDKMDVIVGPLKVSEKDANLDVSIPYLHTTLAIASKQESVPYYILFLRLISSANFLVPLVVMFLLLIISGFIIERLEREKFQSKEHKDLLLNGFIWSLLMFSSVGAETPKRHLSRVYTVIWVFISLFAYASIIGSITSTFTAHELKPEVKNLSDLRKVNVAVRGKSDASVFLLSQHVEFTPFPTLHDAVKALVFNDADAVVGDQMHLRYVIQTFKSAGISLSPTVLDHDSFVFSMPYNSPYKKEIDQMLKKYVGSIEWKNLVYQYLGYVPHLHH